MLHESVKKDIARTLILREVDDIDFIGTVEYMGDNYPDATDDEIREIDDLMGTASITVEWYE